MSDEPRWHPTPDTWRKTPARTPHPQQCAYEFARELDHTRWRCELVDDGEFGIDAQIFRNEEFSYSIRFPNRAFAVAYAELERQLLEQPQMISDIESGS